MREFDDLAIPTPPYRMAHPIASFAAFNSMADQLSKAIATPEVSKEVPPSAPEKSLARKVLEHIATSEGVRDMALEVENAALAALGERLSTATVKLMAMAGARPPVEASALPEKAAADQTPPVAVEAKTAEPEKPATVEVQEPVLAPAREQYRAPKPAEEGLANVRAKQAELQAKGDEKGAKEWDGAIKQYEDYIAQDRRNFEAARASAMRQSATERPARQVGDEQRRPLSNRALRAIDRAEDLKDAQRRPAAIDQAEDEKDAQLRAESIDREEDAKEALRRASETTDVPGFSAVTPEAVTPEAVTPELGNLQADSIPSFQGEPVPQMDAEAVPSNPFPVEASDVRPSRAERGPSIRDRAAAWETRSREAVRGTWIGTVGEWVSRKTGWGAWADTAWPRLKSVYHRQFAEHRAAQQEKAPGSLDRAKEKRDDFKEKFAEASWAPAKNFYAWRARAWEKTIAKREGIVNKHDGYRIKRVERHNELQRQVAERYELELAPYRGKKEALERDQKAALKIIDNLTEDHTAALKVLAEAEAKRKGWWGRKGKGAADKIRSEVEKIEDRISAQRDLLQYISKPLAEASAKVEKYESRQRGVAVAMEFSEMKDLKPVQRPKPGPLPTRRSFNNFTAEASPQAAAEVGVERSGEEWSSADFVESWNGRGLVRIEDPAAFQKYVDDERAAAGESGPVVLGRLLTLTESYLKARRQSRGFAKDSRYFLGNVPKKVIPSPTP